MANENSVELLGSYGGDREHAMSAWTSTSRDIDIEKEQRIPNLLKMLADAGHETPFEKSALHFLVTTDVATHIHIIKHRIGVSVNGESARYKELKEDNFLLPSDWDIPVEWETISKIADIARLDGHDGCAEHFWTQDHYDGKKKEITWADVLNLYSNIGNGLYHLALEELEKKIGRKRAKESARYFKSYNSQMTADVMFNFRSFYHFLKLRNKPEAQKEVRDVAAKMLELVKSIDGNPFEHTIKAFNL